MCHGWSLDLEFRFGTYFSSYRKIPMRSSVQVVSELLFASALTLASDTKSQLKYTRESDTLFSWV
jgi:hypothetical protein